MKYIFDFDDVLFYNTRKFKEWMYNCLIKVDIPRNISETYYKEVREKEFSLINFISELLKRNKKDESQALSIYEEIMKECPNFLNFELTDKVKEYGKENCFIITNGEKKFQEDKIKRSDIRGLFKEIYIVADTKKELIYDICERYKDDKIVFYEDKEKFITDLDMTKCPNLKTVLYKMQ